MLKISELQIKPVKPQGSLIGFCSILVDNSIKMNNLAIHKRLSGGIRIVYPKSHTQDIQNFYPINRAVGKQIEDLIYRKCIDDGLLYDAYSQNKN